MRTESLIFFSHLEKNPLLNKEFLYFCPLPIGNNYDLIMEYKYEYISVDDEISTHFLLEYIMRRYPEYHRQAYFTDSETALHYLSNNQVDLMFLDVEMPDMDGFALIDKVKSPPLTIMVTGYPTEYSERAHEYYDHGIIDFMSKSIAPERFEKSLNRFEKLKKTAINGKSVIKSPTISQLKTVTIPHFVEDRSINLYEILYVTVEKNYLSICTRDGNMHKIRSSLQLFEEVYLPEDHFLRVSRDTIVALHHVASFNSYSLQVGSKEQGGEHLIPISVIRRRDVKMRLAEYLSKWEE